MKDYIVSILAVIVLSWVLHRLGASGEVAWIMGFGLVVLWKLCGGK